MTYQHVYKKERDVELLRKFFELKKTYPDDLNSGIIEKLVSCESKKLYASRQYCIDFIKCIQQGKVSRKHLKEKCRLYKYLYESFEELLLETPDIQTEQAVEIIMQKPAPSFFINERTAYAIICHQLKLTNKERKML
ncbi:hypothetical protein AGMMS49965_13210 [Bacteroidia bacterium]|nr:hypothetical protein AGMMS49965_13210 [Bacteroidia bacterium]